MEQQGQEQRINIVRGETGCQGQRERANLNLSSSVACSSIDEMR